MFEITGLCKTTLTIVLIAVANNWVEVQRILAEAKFEAAYHTLSVARIRCAA